jgi:hypothetical protein
MVKGSGLRMATATSVSFESENFLQPRQLMAQRWHSAILLRI